MPNINLDLFNVLSNFGIAGSSIKKPILFMTTLFPRVFAQNSTDDANDSDDFRSTVLSALPIFIGFSIFCIFIARYKELTNESENENNLPQTQNTEPLQIQNQDIEQEPINRYDTSYHAIDP